MKQKTVVNIYDMEFTFVGEESEEYVQKIAALVDQRMREVTENSKYSTLAAAVLTAANIADDYYKALDATEELRGQLRGYFEEISRLKDENDHLRRASRPAAARRSRRSLFEEPAPETAPAVEPAPSEEPAEAAVLKELAEIAKPSKLPEVPEETAVAEEPELPEEPQAEEPQTEEPDVAEEPGVPEVTLVMDSDIEAAESGLETPAPEELAEGEQLVFEK